MYFDYVYTTDLPADAPAKRLGWGTLTNISGTNLTYLYCGGDICIEMENAGWQAAMDWGLNELVQVLGSDVKKYFLKGNFTRWGHHPWTLGSYACSEPGYWNYREELRKPLAEKVFFAGEACSERYWATCAGALMNGIDVAGQVAKIAKKK